jgi:hypothetical protein
MSFTRLAAIAAFLLVTHPSTRANAQPAAAVASAEAPAPVPRSPDVPPIRVEAQLLGYGALPRLEGEPLADQAPYRSAGLGLGGDPRALGGGFSLALESHGFRGGFDLIYYGLAGSTLDHAPLPHDLTLRGTTARGFVNDTFFGYTFDLGWIRPHIDIVGGFSVVQAETVAFSRTSGLRSVLTHEIVSPVFGPRVGVSIPLGPLFLSAEISHSFAGTAGTSVMFGLGMFIDGD